MTGRSSLFFGGELEMYPAGTVVFFNASNEANRLQAFASHLAFRIFTKSNFGHVAFARGDGQCYAAIAGWGVVDDESDANANAHLPYKGDFLNVTTFIRQHLGEPYNFLGMLLCNPIYNLSGRRIRLYGQNWWNCATLLACAFLADPECPEPVRKALSSRDVGATTPQDIYDALLLQEGVQPDPPSQPKQ